jgi:hypothetical protein
MRDSRLRVAMTTLALASLSLTLVAAKPAHAPAKLPTTENVTVAADIDGDAYDGVTPASFDGDLSFTNDGTETYIIVNFTLPSGAIIEYAEVEVDGFEHLDFAFVGNELKVFGLTLGQFGEVTAYVEGTHVLEGGDHGVSAQYKTEEPRRPKKNDPATMWQEKVCGGFLVEEYVPPAIEAIPLEESLVEEAAVEPEFEPALD